MSDIITKVKRNSDGTLLFSSVQDVEGILDQNVREANENLNRKDEDTFGRKVATIPLAIVNMWCKEWNCTMFELTSDPMMKARMFARLRDRDWLKLRTDSGKI